MNDYGSPAEADGYAYGGATTFAEAERFSDAMEQQQEAANVMGTFDSLMANIRHNPMLTPEEKGVAMAALVTELQARMSTAQGAKDAEATTTDPGTLMCFKDNSGAWRWTAIHSNKFADRTKEIFSEQSHQDYVEWVNRTKQFPALRLWHIPVDVGRADFVDYDTNGFVVSSGKFNPGMEDVAQRLAGMKGLGCSHGYLYRRGDLVDGVYRAYRSYEISALPVDRSANTLTAFFAESEVPMLTAARKSFLVDVMGEERANTIERGVEQLAQIAGERGLSYKSLEEALLEGSRAVGDEKCPECGDMVAADDMKAHMADKHGDTEDAKKDDTTAVADAPTTDAVTTEVDAGAAPVLDADGNPVVISTEGQEPEGAADAEAQTPPADAETPSAEDRAAAAQAMQDAGLGDGDATGAKADDDVLTALKAAFSETMAPVMQRMAQQDEVIDGLKALVDQQAGEIALLQGSRDDEIAEAIRPRVGLDHRAAPASTSADNVVEDAEAQRVVALSGQKDEPSGPAAPYVSDLLGLLRSGVMGAPVATH